MHILFRFLCQYCHFFKGPKTDPWGAPYLMFFFSPRSCCFHVGLLCLLTTSLILNTLWCMSFLYERSAILKAQGLWLPLPLRLANLCRLFACDWQSFFVFFVFFCFVPHPTPPPPRPRLFLYKTPICWFCKYCKMHFDIIDMFLIYTS